MTRVVLDAFSCFLYIDRINASMLYYLPPSKKKEQNKTRQNLIRQKQNVGPYKYVYLLYLVWPRPTAFTAAIRLDMDCGILMGRPSRLCIELS